jgi:hypothetical protein
MQLIKVLNIVALLETFLGLKEKKLFLNIMMDMFLFNLKLIKNIILKLINLLGIGNTGRIKWRVVEGATIAGAVWASAWHRWRERA